MAPAPAAAAERTIEEDFEAALPGAQWEVR